MDSQKCMWGRRSERPLYPSIWGFGYVLGLENAGPRMEGNSKGRSESLPHIKDIVLGLDRPWPCALRQIWVATDELLNFQKTF